MIKQIEIEEYRDGKVVYSNREDGMINADITWRDQSFTGFWRNIDAAKVNAHDLIDHLESGRHVSEYGQPQA